MVVLVAVTFSLSVRGESFFSILVFYEEEVFPGLSQSLNHFTSDDVNLGKVTEPTGVCLATFFFLGGAAHREK